MSRKPRSRHEGTYRIGIRLSYRRDQKYMVQEDPEDGRAEKHPHVLNSEQLSEYSTDRMLEREGSVVVESNERWEVAYCLLIGPHIPGIADQQKDNGH